MLDTNKNTKTILEKKKNDGVNVEINSGASTPQNTNSSLKNNKNSSFQNKQSSSFSNKKMSVTGYEEKVVNVKKISKTTKGGRNMRFSALVVIGDKKGLVGFGMGKSIEVPVAIKKALKNAKNNMFKIKYNKNFTLFHEVLGKHGVGKVLIKPAKPGTGIIAGGPVRVVLELAGFKDVYSKNLGKNTPINMVRATIVGLLSQKTPKEIANLRDKDIKNL